MGLTPKMAFFCNNFFRCMLSLRQLCIFETSIKFCIFYTSYDQFQIFFLPILQDDEIFRGVFQKVMGANKMFNACSGHTTHRHNNLKMVRVC
jgi:hypothetical protein